jgi:hypothetical protein
MTNAVRRVFPDWARAIRRVAPHGAIYSSVAYGLIDRGDFGRPEAKARGVSLSCRGGGLSDARCRVRQTYPHWGVLRFVRRTLPAASFSERAATQYDTSPMGASETFFAGSPRPSGLARGARAGCARAILRRTEPMGAWSSRWT